MLASTGRLPGIEVSLRPEVAIEGRVYGPDRRSVAGATIALAADCSGKILPLGGRVRSDGDGAYHLRGIDSGADFTLIARLLRPDGTELRSEPFPLSRVVSPVPGRIFWWDLHLELVTPETMVVCSTVNRTEPGSFRPTRAK